MSSRGFTFPLSMRWIAVYAFALVALLGVYLVSFSDVGYHFRNLTTHVDDSHNAPATQPPPATVTSNLPPLSSTSPTGANPAAGDPVEPLESPKPGQVKIVGLVFFGRRDLVRVLDCYLKRNLRINGGLLDEVVFAINTDIKEDLDYLDNELLPSPYYRKFTATDEHGFLGQWSAVDERDTIYIKIDDDVVFIDDGTIASVVRPLIENPSYFAVSANVVNNPALSWVHYHMGVFEPYWPEMMKPWKPSSPSSWRASELPAYKGPAEGPDNFDIDGSTPAPFTGHRWLPVRQKEKGETEDPTKFPASTLTYDPFGPSWDNWAAGAQLHYSFLQHLENNETSLYKFGIWDCHYDRVSINFIALRGGDIMDAYPFTEEDDEYFLTVEHAKKIGKHVVVAGNGLAVHFAFGPQRMANYEHGISDTDLLGRYTAYAKEMVCPFPKREVKASPLVRPSEKSRRRGPGRSR
ncbi:uncharacterized protein B0H64DRAFT_388888 [Chaetomium fimeti]|uniref:Uncharacterized protein n=1 Tax=Chaetomium fimeti TaxID=1854472 RepID=A0AAE0HMY5_9PEZI|nr:hypothetical protein B0H64DRAFT_388888 [Chaetomium fimeti]